ncbi:MAG: hypothetical protein HWN81_00185 [Candidatus Lokiarchaeota archaeon]|nr:hypothetical protein [Candidatus Lokiarchaeota archaeon]
MANKKPKINIDAVNLIAQKYLEIKAIEEQYDLKYFIVCEETEEFISDFLELNVLRLIKKPVKIPEMPLKAPTFKVKNDCGKYDFIWTKDKLLAERDLNDSGALQITIYHIAELPFERLAIYCHNKWLLLEDYYDYDKAERIAKKYYKWKFDQAFEDVFLSKKENKIINNCCNCLHGERIHDNCYDCGISKKSVGDGSIMPDDCPMAQQ